jgi:hypothetical protein
MSSANLVVNLTFPTGGKLSVPTGLFIVRTVFGRSRQSAHIYHLSIRSIPQDNQFVPSVDGTTIKCFRPATLALRMT